MVLDNLPKEFTVVSLDESFFLYDSLVRKVWIFRNTRPVVRITGSHQQSSLFGAISLDGRQLFRQYNHFNEDTFCEFLKLIHHKFPKCYVFLDKAHQHYKSHKIREYIKERKGSLIPVYLPTASPEFMILEECWNISKSDLLLLTYYTSFRDFRTKIGQYFRTKHFKFNMYKYLTGYGS